MESSNNMEGMATRKSLAAARFLKLIDRLMVKHHDVQARVAEATGLKPGAVNNWVSRERLGVSWPTIEKVAANLKLNTEYFTDTSVRDPNYEDYLLSKRPASRPAHDEPTTRDTTMTPAFLDQLFDGLRATAAERDELRDYVAIFQTTLDPKFVQGFINGLRRRGSRLRAGDDALNEQVADDSESDDDE